MRRISLWLLAAAALTLTACGGDNKEEPAEPTPSAPTGITLTPDSISDPVAGGSHSVAISAPARPTVEVPTAAKGWITVKDGTWNKDKYSMTITVNVAANEGYDVREAELTVKAGSATAVTLKVSQAANEKPEDPGTGEENNATARTAELGLGWNMGNHMDAFYNGVANETCWGNPLATQATFNGVKAAGFTSVRIPVTWLGHIGEAPEYKIEDAWMNRVYEIVGYAEKAGLNVILNTHHDEDHGEGHWQNLAKAVNSETDNILIKDEIAAVWTQIAYKFKDKGEFLMFESFNELIYGNEWSSSSNTEKRCGIINEWNQVFVDAVRATGGNNATRWLGVPGYAASPSYLKYVVVPDDPANKTMLAFHCYDPYDYTIGDKQTPDWGHTGTSFPKGEEQIKNLFAGIYSTYIAKNIPVYMGEFGCSMRDKNNAQTWAYYLYYLEYVVKAAKTYHISAFLWDNGAKGVGKECHAYIDHGTGNYIGNSQLPVKAMVKAWSTKSPTYTLDYVYNTAPTF